MHPWEDWAETFSFYLNIVDVLETATASGLIRVDGDDDIAKMVDTYTQLGILLNELNRAKGLMDFKPEVVAPNIIAKLQCVHDVVIQAARDRTPLEAA
jgi:hypothetical protein